jgi:hypothetical protein
MENNEIDFLNIFRDDEENVNEFKKLNSLAGSDLRLAHLGEVVAKQIRVPINQKRAVHFSQKLSNPIASNERKRSVHLSHIYERVLKFQSRETMFNIMPKVVSDDFFLHFPHMLINAINSIDKTIFLKFFDSNADDSVHMKSSFLNSPFYDYQNTGSFALNISTKLEILKFWFMLTIISKDFKVQLTSNPKVIIMNDITTVEFDSLITYSLVFDNNFNIQHVKPFFSSDNMDNNGINNIDINKEEVTNKLEKVEKVSSLFNCCRKQQMNRAFLGKKRYHFNNKNLIFLVEFLV